MDVLMRKRVLSATVLAMIFVLSIVVVVVLVMKGRKGAPWAVPGAALDGLRTVQGKSDGFDGKTACVQLSNTSAKLSAKMKKTNVGPKSVYERDRCDSGAGGRNAVPGTLAPCAEGVVLRPGESCRVGVRLVTGGRPDGRIDLSTEVMCTNREIEPCGLLREGMNPTAEKPLALTIDQRTEFPKSDTGFRLTTERAELTATETAPLPGPEPQPGVTSPEVTGSPGTPSVTDTGGEVTESESAPVDPGQAPDPREDGSPEPERPEPGQGPAS